MWIHLEICFETKEVDTFNFSLFLTNEIYDILHTETNLKWEMGYIYKTRKKTFVFN